MNTIIPAHEGFFILPSATELADLVKRMTGVELDRQLRRHPVMAWCIYETAATGTARPIGIPLTAEDMLPGVVHQLGSHVAILLPDGVVVEPGQRASKSPHMYHANGFTYWNTLDAYVRAATKHPPK